MRLYLWLHKQRNTKDQQAHLAKKVRALMRIKDDDVSRLAELALIVRI